MFAWSNKMSTDVKCPEDDNRGPVSLNFKSKKVFEVHSFCPSLYAVLGEDIIEVLV